MDSSRSEAERHQRLKEAFHRAAELDADARHQAVAALAATEPDLGRELAALLAADAKSGPFLDRDAFAAAPPREVAGERGWRLLRPLGSGGMGTVHLAERADGAFRQQVAIKLLHPALAESADAAQRFRAERQILADLHHPHITRLLDGGTTADGRPFLVMELVDGEPLDVYADRLPIDERLRLFALVCRAVGFAHARGVVHRDLKPGNVLVDREGHPRLLDFGVAKLLEPLPDRTRHETALGHAPLTLLYASPEQVRGGAVTAASDVYALGVILYRLTTGELPYGGEQRETPHSLALAICERDPERPSTAARRRTAERREGETTTGRGPRIGGDLDAIVLRALRKEPAARYASADALADDVDRLLAGRPVEARRGSGVYRARKLLRRHALRLAFAAVAVAAVAGSAWLTRRLVSPPPLLARGEIGRVAVLPFRNETGVAGYAWVEQGLAEMVGQLLDEAPQVEVVAPADVRRAVGDLGIAGAALDEPQPLARLRGALGADFTLAVRVRRAGPGELRLDYALGGQDGRGRWRELRGSEPAALAAEVAQRTVRRLDPTAAPAARDGTSGGAERLADDPTANTLYAMGLQELAHGDGRDAQHYFYVALHRAPDFHWARLMLARSLLAMKAWGDADAALEETLRRARAAGDARLVGEALASLGRSAASQGRPDDARRWDGQALVVLRRAGHRKGLASVLNNLGNLARQRGDLDEAERQIRASLALLEELHEPQGQAARLNNLGLIAAGRKDFPHASALYRDAWARAERSGDRALQLTVLGNSGLLALERGDVAAAASYFGRARELAAALGNAADEALALLNLAAVAQRQRGAAAAEELLRQSLVLSRKAAEPRLEGYGLANLSFALAERGDYAGAATAAREGRALATRVEDATLRLLAATNLGWAEAWRGDLAAADRALADAAEVDAGDAALLRVRALVAYRRRELADAVALQERAKAAAPGRWLPDHEAMLALFRAAARRGRPLPLPVKRAGT